MAKQTINVGSAANDGSGDKLRTAFTKVNANFDELYAGGVGGGSQGATGTQGAQGANGGTGPSGPQGTDGAAGSTGPSGPQGANGGTGPSGPQGANGGTGPSGPQGTDGAAGSTGPSGPQGTDGSAGPSGPQGTDGGTGPSGPQGVQGSVGSGISNVVEDTTPQLGGNLDVNGKDIVSTGNGNISIVPDTDGDIILTASGTGIVSVTGDLTVGGDVTMDGNLVGVSRLQPQANPMTEIVIPVDADANTNPLTIYAEGNAGVEITGGLILTPDTVIGDANAANATIPTTQSVVMLNVLDPSAAQFYLPDATEGQILHLIPVSTATGDAALISLTIDNYRYIDGNGTAVIESTSVSGNNFYLFSTGTFAMATMVFANGAWVASQGQWT